MEPLQDKAAAKGDVREKAKTGPQDRSPIKPWNVRAEKWREEAFGMWMHEE